MNAFDESSQWRYPGGYQWLPADRAAAPKRADKSDLVLTTGRPLGSYKVDAYRPPSNLFLLFAHTPETLDGIKRFADQYGLLGEEVIMVVGDASRATKKRIRGLLGAGELFSTWRHQIQQMRQGIEIWSALRDAAAGDMTKLLSGRVRWHGRKLVIYDSHPHLRLPPLATIFGIPSSAHYASGRKPDKEEGLRTLAVIASEALNSEWLKRFQVGDYLVPARYYLQKLVNEHLVS